MSQPNKIFINNLVNYQNSELLERVLQLTLEHEQITGKELSLTLTDDQYIQKLNSQYRLIDAPTDVLSFTLDEDNLLGDIFISVPTAMKNAREYNDGNLQNEMVKLSVHGLLHLLGHDHEQDLEADLMEKKEEIIINYATQTLLF